MAQGVLPVDVEDVESLKDPEESSDLGLLNRAYWPPFQAFAVSNERGYAELARSLKERGGVFLSICGGMDPALTYASVIRPERLLFVDINPTQFKCLKARKKCILDSRNSLEFWERYSQHLTDKAHILRLIPNPFCISSDPTKNIDDYTQGGWSSEKSFYIVKEMFQSGIVRCVLGDMTSVGLDTAREAAQSLNRPIEHIYLSNIHERMKENQSRRFIARVGIMYQEGTLANDCKFLVSPRVAGQHLGSAIFNLDQTIELFQNITTW